MAAFRPAACRTHQTYVPRRHTVQPEVQVALLVRTDHDPDRPLKAHVKDNHSLRWLLRWCRSAASCSTPQASRRGALQRSSRISHSPLNSFRAGILLARLLRPFGPLLRDGSFRREGRRVFLAEAARSYRRQIVKPCRIAGRCLDSLAPRVTALAVLHMASRSVKPREKHRNVSIFTALSSSGAGASSPSRPQSSPHADGAVVATTASLKFLATVVAAKSQREGGGFPPLHRRLPG